MAGYLYCMRNTHPTYRRYVKLGYTERFPEERVRDLSEKWRCAFELLWDMPVFDPARAEHFLHEHLHSSRVIYEFFNIDAQIAKDLAEQLFDENWENRGQSTFLDSQTRRLTILCAFSEIQDYP